LSESFGRDVQTTQKNANWHHAHTHDAGRFMYQNVRNKISFTKIGRNAVKNETEIQFQKMKSLH
jgi:hypothetical protein